MANSKITKRAFVSSALAVLMCVVMLIGATFAWFTSTASTAVNQIQAGTLGIQLVDEAGNNLEGTTLNFKKAADGAGETILWEPGATYELPAVYVKNNGTLALKYKIAISGIDGDEKLLEAIDWTVSDTALDADHHLTAGATSEALTIKGHMQEDAGNEYQNLSLNGIAITVYATQDTVEYDSTDNQYDNDAKYTEVVAAGKTFSSGTYVLSTGITATNAGAIAVTATGTDTNVTITDGTFDGGSGGNNQCVRVVDGATVTITGGTFTVGSDATGGGNSVIESKGGNIVIEGGFFKTDYQYGGRYYVLNQVNSNPGTITVKGGTFVNYDPSTGDDNLGGNFVADGYKVVSETQANGDVWYTVVADTEA